MDMLTGEQIAEANLTDWRKLSQGLHARYLVGDFGSGVRFIAAVGKAGDAAGHHPRVTMGDEYVDLKLVSDDAVYRDDEGTEHAATIAPVWAALLTGSSDAVGRGTIGDHATPAAGSVTR